MSMHDILLVKAIIRERREEAERARLIALAKRNSKSRPKSKRQLRQASARNDASHGT